MQDIALTSINLTNVALINELFLTATRNISEKPTDIF
jgi:hypothetical protein